jgi:mycofactocin precursor
MAADQSSAPANDVVETPADDEVVEELLVEEVSIDGMCGVY